ncbi:hypothetical protein MKEN_00321500 [Mycena kentingensis (nom. inval.)]|nr:hypothetical protein MKEN_00321500 [Mycena kentingensis (nom. inval.)]
MRSALLALAALAWRANAAPRVLLYTATAGFRHDSIPVAIEALQAQSATLNVTFDPTEDRSLFNDANLANYDAVMFVSTTGEVLDDTGKAAFQNYLNLGGIFVQVFVKVPHSLVNTTFFGQEVGAFFDYHADLQNATVDILVDHPSTSGLPKEWHIQVTLKKCTTSNRTRGKLARLWFWLRTSRVTLILGSASLTKERHTRLLGTKSTAPAFKKVLQLDEVSTRHWATSTRHGRQHPLFMAHVTGGLMWALQGNTTRAFNSSARVGNSGSDSATSPISSTGASPSMIRYLDKIIRYYFGPSRRVGICVRSDLSQALGLVSSSMRLQQLGRPASAMLRRGLVTPSAHASAPASAVKLAQRPPDAPAPSEDLPTISTSADKVSVGWDTRTWSRFHNIWLRDHCRCPACFHQITKQRLVNTFDIPPGIAPSKAEPTSDGLLLTWPSSQPHESLYPWSWLRQNSYDPQIPDARVVAPEKILWGSKILSSPPTVTYEEAMADDDRGLHKWLANIDRFGMCFISGVPPTPEATEELSQRIGFIRQTQYGKFWDFTSDLAKSDTAYTTLALGAHTDNTYFTDPCGLQLFHLLSHTDGTGGSTLLVDGFYVADILKELHPEAYAVLSQTPVPAHAAGEPSVFYTPSPPGGYPVLNHDPVSGKLAQVRWNNDDRSVMNHLSPQQVEAWYAAVRIWHKLLTSADSEYWVQLGPGMAVVVDNHRVLHGRSSFTGKRRMCGAYIGVDEYHSKLAVLRERFETSAMVDHFERNIWSAGL